MGNLHPLSIYAFIVATLCIIAISVLTGLHDSVPSELPDALFALIGTSATSGILNPPSKG